LGSLCRLGELAPFDAQGDFILRYGERRSEFENQLGLTRSGSGSVPSTP